MQIEQLRSERTKELESAKRLLEAKPFTKEQGDAFDAHLKRADDLKYEIEKRERTAEWVRTHEGPISGQDERQESRGNDWFDVQNNRRIRVLSPKESLRKLTAGEQSKLGFGAFLRAMVLGPQSPEEKRALSEGTDSAGGYLVPTPLSAELIDRLRARSVCVQAGARTVEFNSATLKMARLATDPVSTWRAENSAINSSDAVFEGVVFTARTLAGLVPASRELLEDATNLEDALLNAFSKSLASELDRVALIGSGTPPEPRGISNTTGVLSTSMGTNGAQVTSYDDLLSALAALRTANAADPTAAVMSPRTEASYNKMKDSTGQSLRRPAALANLPFLVTSKLPTNETQGSASTASRLIMGNFAELMIGIRTQIRIDVSRDVFAANGQYAFISWLRADIQLMHPASFAQIVGILP